MANTLGPKELQQHPHVERLKPDPSQPAQRVVVLTGLPGKSDREGYQRLYLTTKLDYYAEFRIADMVASQAVAANQSPLPDHDATQVSIARDATIHYTWARSPQPVDEFDLDIRLGPPGAAPSVQVGAVTVLEATNYNCFVLGGTRCCPGFPTASCPWPNYCGVR
jgi:hypothetical protein